MHLLPGMQRRQGPGPNPDPSSNPPSTATSAPTQSSNVDLGSLPSPTSSAIVESISPTATASHHKGSSSTVIVAVVVAIVAVLAVISAWWFLRRTRAKHKNPKYVPTNFLKKLWEKWEPGPIHYRLPDTNDHLEPQRTVGSSRSAQPPASFDTAASRAVTTANNDAATSTVGVDRNTSVRSVMTLPAYYPSARESEQVLGREGERGGIDVVIEFPEGADEEEERREAEMEALYQVRLARRRENEEREERRRLRREARERGDYVALRELQARARAGSAASGQRTVEELRAEHDRMKKERQRAVSSVSYGDLGVARHDGTRLRANSNDSEREGLLGDAASFAASSRYHRRDRSASSVLSIDTVNSDLPSPGLTRSRANSAARPESPLRRVSTSHSQGRASPQPSHEGRAGSSPEMIEHEDIPPNSPPGYENISLDTPQDERPEPPPDYSSPILARGEHTPLFDSGRPTTETRSRPTSTHIGQLIADRRTSSSSSAGSSRGVGGTPQLPSLRLATLPSIHVDGPSPVVPRVDEEHHPEE